MSTGLKDYSQDEKELTKFVKRLPFGTMIFYQKVFGIENAMLLQIDNGDYMVLDSYCATPYCDCSDMAINLFKINSETVLEKPDFSFVYNYKSNKYENDMNIGQDIIENQIIPNLLNLNKLFKERHKQLKEKLYSLMQKKQRQAVLKKQKKNWKSDKIGRNDSCPCGSGKKYKKCCIDK